MFYSDKLELNQVRINRSFLFRCFNSFYTLIASCSNQVEGSRKCTFDYGFGNVETSDFSIGWGVYNASSAHSSFKYTQARTIDSFPYAGAYNNYLGGGYVYQLDLSKDTTELTDDLVFLQENDWTDQRTRALFIEFTVYNVNLDLFAYCTILFEYLPTGNVIIYHEFAPISLYASESGFAIAFDIIYLFLTIFMVLNEIKLIVKLKHKYTRRYISYLNWILIVFSWVSFTMFMYRLYEKWTLTSKISSNNNQVINFQSINYWNNMLLIFLGICCFMASLKLIYYLSISRTIRMLIKVFRLCLKEMLSFILIFIVIILAFINLMYFMVCDKNEQFNSFPRALVRGFLMINGNFDLQKFLDNSGFLGHIIYSVFVVVVILSLLNMFITLLVSCFSEIRAEYKEQTGQEDPVAFMMYKKKIAPKVSQIMESVGFKKTNSSNKYKRMSLHPQDSNDSQYKDTVDLFSFKTSQLASKVYDENKLVNELVRKKSTV